MKKRVPNRNREKNKNLSGLYAVPRDIAYNGGKLRKGVYGAVNTKTPYVFDPGSEKRSIRFKADLCGTLPKSVKNRILAFFDDKSNNSKSTCYLAEKPLYEEMLHKKGIPLPKPKPKKASKPKKQSSSWDDFDYDHRGRIKGSYTPDGFFEPD